MHEVIWLEASAPAKPPPGEPCNGCGVCCASAPCPIGILVSRRFGGRCAALVWDAAGARYRCGVVEASARWQGRWRRATPVLSRLARRYIAAGQGCDCSLEAAGPAAGPG